MIRAAAGYIVRNGPTTEQDRWEEDSGYSAFTIGASNLSIARRGGRDGSFGEGSIARISGKRRMDGTSRSKIGPMQGYRTLAQARSRTDIH